MSDRSNGVEWVETAEEVVITEECLPPENTTAEPAETPIQRLLDTVGHVDNVVANDGFYCEECLTLFQDQSDPADISGPAFILDFPTTMGVPQRALLTLPYGLMVGRSSIPSAGIGVLNHGPIVSPGMHFGPYEGELTTLEASMASDFSWEICKGKDEYEYVDAARESHSNWMRYVNWARNKDESNLLAVQHKGSILFHCRRTINPGDELMVWPSSRLLSRFSEAWTQVWLMKLNATESNAAATSPIFACSHCPLSFTTESFLQRHGEFFHAQLNANSTTLPAESVEAGNPASAADSGDSAASLVLLSADPVESNTCGDCGKVFKQMPHLKRHKLCVHANKRPYCCPQCRRSFSQASGLIRHQQVHRKQAVTKETVIVTNHTAVLSERPRSEPTAVTEDTKDGNVSESPQEVMDVTETERTSAGAASQCNRSDSSTNEESLKEREETVRGTFRPYVCSVCQKSFRQHSDLSRHQRPSKDGARSDLPPDESTVATFSCADCLLVFSSVDHLQQHVSERNSEETVAENQDDLPAPAGEDQSHDPDFVPRPSLVETVESLPKRCSQRPQRLGAGSKISAITKLIAPKRRAAVCKKPSTDGAQAERVSSEPQAPAGKNPKLTNSKRFSCDRCKRTYANAEELKAHKCALRQHKCGQCGTTFKKSGFLKRHEQTAHVGAKSHSCDSCCKVFSTSGKLERHRKNNACGKYRCTSELFSCSFCQFSFTMKNYLIKHVRRHHPVEYLSNGDSESLADPLREEKEEEEEEACVCRHCEKSFSSAKSFKSHACFQQVKVLYLCTDCGKGFANHYGLKQHQRIHTGEKPYTCPHCSKGFSYSGQLNVHLRTHTGEKPYLCTHCGESFRQSGDLKRHERKHTGVRPYSCPECCKSFSRLQSLKAHQMLHQGQRMFKCAQCGKSFSRNYHLRRHHQKMHS